MNQIFIRSYIIGISENAISYLTGLKGTSLNISYMTTSPSNYLHVESMPTKVSNHKITSDYFKGTFNIKKHKPLEER